MELLICLLGGELLSGLYESDVLRAVSGSEGELLNSLNVIEKYLSGMKDAANPRLQVELCLIELCGLEAVQTVYVPAAAEQKSEPKRETKPAPVKKIEPEKKIESVKKAEPVSEPEPEELPPWEDEPPYVPPADDFEEDVPFVYTEEIEAPLEEPIPPVEEIRETSPMPEGQLSWRAIVDALQDKLDVGTHMLFTDDFAVTGQWENGELCIEVMPGFYMNMLNKSEVLDAVRSVCGAPVRIRELRSPAEIREDKLNALSKFDNVTFQD